jgi:hypothetical protein
LRAYGRLSRYCGAALLFCHHAMAGPAHGDLLIGIGSGRPGPAL